VTPGTTYTYFIRATNEAGSTDSNSITLATLGPVTKPGAFTLSGEAARSGGIPENHLSWTASSAATSYAVYRNGSPYFQLQTLGTTFNNAEVTPGTTYTYFIRATNEAGSTDSNSITLATLGPVTKPGAFTLSPSSFSFSATQGGPNPSSQTLSIQNSGGGTLNWSVSDDTAWLTLSPSSGTSTGEIDPVMVSVNIAGMNAGSYSATITISASGGTNASHTVPVSLTIEPFAPVDVPSPPQNLRVTDVGDGYAKLAWDLPASDGGSPLTGYRLYRGTSPGGESFYDATTPDWTSYNNANITNGTTYYYQVTAVNVVGESNFSNEVSATPRARAGEVIVKPITGTIIVSTNLETAGFTIAGPKQLAGQSSFSIFPNVSVGVYTITYKDAVGYDTPRPETKTLTEEGKIQFIGEYNKVVVLTTTDASLQEVIKEYTQEETSITIDGEQYYIVTLKGYIDPETLQPSDEPGIWKVYVDTSWKPVSNEKTLRKIAILDKANSFLTGAGSQQNIVENINALTIIEEGDMWASYAEKTEKLVHDWFEGSLDAIALIYNIEVVAKYFPEVDITKIDSADELIYLARTRSEIEQQILKMVSEEVTNRVLSEIGDEVIEFMDPEIFKISLGKTALKISYEEYGQALSMASAHKEGFTDCTSAEEYLHHCYTAYLYNVFASQQILSDERLEQKNKNLLNALLTVGEWMGEWTIKKVPLVSTLLKIYKASEYTEKWRTDVKECLNEFYSIEFKANVWGEEPNKKAVLYTIALKERDRTKLTPFLDTYIHGVDEIKITIACTAELRVYDSDGRITGIVNEEIRIEIPNSWYYNDTVTIFSPTDLYRYEIVGTGEGHYNLTVRYVGAQPTSFTITDTSISTNATHQYIPEWDNSTRNVSKITIKKDSDGNGVFETNITIELFGSGEPASALICAIVATLSIGILIVGSVYVRKRRQKKAVLDKEKRIEGIFIDCSLEVS